MNKKLFTTLLLAAALCVCLLATGCSSGMARDLTNADFVYNYLSEGITDRMTVWGCTPLKVSKVELISENGAERLCTVTAKNEAFTVIGDYVLTYEGKQLAGIKEADDFDQQVILTVPKSVDTVTSEQFKDFAELTEVVFHANFIQFNNSAFENCTALKTVTFNCKEYTAIASSAFKNCTSLTDFTFPDSCNFVLEEAFAGCTSLTFTAPPKGVVFVGTRAFAGCTSLTEANMGEGCDTISNYAFENCTGLKKIYVGMDMAEISASAFVGCPNVEEIEIESTNKAFVLTANKMLKCRGTGHYVYSLLHEEIPLPEEATDAADSTSSETTQE